MPSQSHDDLEPLREITTTTSSTASANQLRKNMMVPVEASLAASRPATAISVKEARAPLIHAAARSTCGVRLPPG